MKHQLLNNLLVNDKPNSCPDGAALGGVRFRSVLCFILFSLCPIIAVAQPPPITVHGTVVTQLDGTPLPGVNVVIKGTASGVITDANGEFALRCDPAAILIFSYIGYETLEVPVGGRTTLKIELSEGLEMLAGVEIYSTGYQAIPPERATGSFEHVDQELLNRSTGTDLISRLEGVTSGLLFDKRLASDTHGQDYRSLRIRGINSIDTDNSPLIVVDNFPYEGDINNINPNDVESVTVLKDAAAASIWGARAANGVIVIITKKGMYNQPFRVTFNSNMTIGERPDLHYSPDYLPAPDFIDVERILFDRGYYTRDENSVYKSPLSPVVELLIKERDGLITADELENELEALSRRDVREEAEDHFYRTSIRQQYALNMQGGTDDMQYYLSGGYDKNISNIDGNQFQRVTLVSNNTMHPVESLGINIGLNFMHNWSQSNGSRWGTVDTRFPYNTLADETGNALPVVNFYRQAYIEEAEENGLLDWQYRPLQEKALRDYNAANTEYRINTGINYSFLKKFDIDVKYQYQKIIGKNRNLRSEESHYVRSLVNRFTQADGTRIFPVGDILNESNSDQIVHAARGQLNYNESINQHLISALAGMEVRQVHVSESGLEVYGYDDDVLTFTEDLDYTTRFPVRPRGFSWINPPATRLSDLTDRYISYYGNASYSYNDRYILTASMRWDASNLFGVKTNQKGVPLWSVGGSWEVSGEKFYNLRWLPYVRMRATYGYNGNINKSVTAYPTVRYFTDYLTGLPTVNLRSPGNPQLRWEKIGVFNLGIDFQLRNRRLVGSIEYYNKRGKDIIGESPLDPTTGFIPSVTLVNRINYAETQTKGLDLQLSALIIDRELDWKADVLFSYTKNTILEHYNDAITRNNILSSLDLNSSILPQEGKPIDGLYSLPWRGLESTTGDPQVVVEGQVGKDYRDYINDLTLEDLVYHGVSVPPLFGSIRNTLTWKGLSVSANISWKTGYYFRRSGISYEQLFSNWIGHKEFKNRWRKPGDQNSTQVPSMPEVSNTYRDIVYTGSELMIEKGDHIRLEDINISYGLKKTTFPWLPVDKLSVFLYARNLGILWRANGLGLDPDYPGTTYLQPRSISLGINATF